MKAEKLRVALPLGRPVYTETITSDAEHLGNLIAEGRMHPSMFWPRLAQMKAAESRRLEVELLEKHRQLDGLLQIFLEVAE